MDNQIMEVRVNLVDVIGYPMTIIVALSILAGILLFVIGLRARSDGQVAAVMGHWLTTLSVAMFFFGVMSQASIIIRMCQMAGLGGMAHPEVLWHEYFVSYGRVCIGTLVALVLWIAAAIVKGRCIRRS